jgi:SAM-dependent methyltransferase
VNVYDQVPYPIGVYRQTHPDRLATLGILRGMQPQPVDRCRVLELGCGGGLNLISMAVRLPESQFVGVDLAQSAVAAGQAMAAELDLTNIRLECCDVTALDREALGRFDYIIAHGLYSWVPEQARKSILETCAGMLTAQGIAYISYNAYPGNHFRELARGLMRYHAANFGDAQEKVRQARGVLKFVADSPAEPTTYQAILRTELDRVMKYPDEVFFHDDLSEVNQPFYFHEFVRDAVQYGLRFLGEASPETLNLSKYTAETKARLKELDRASEIDREQYKDFLTGCGFRETVLCRAQVELSVGLQGEKISRMYVSCDAKPIESTGDSVTFQLQDKEEFVSAHPLATAGLRYVCSCWPCAVSFREVLTEARASLGRTDPGTEDDETRQLSEAITAVFEAGVVYLHTIPPKVVNQVSEKPVCSALARLQVRRGQTATNQRHQSVRFTDETSRALVQLLDGTRDLDDLVRALEQLGPPPVEEGKTFRDQVKAALESFVQLAMLVA